MVFWKLTALLVVATFIAVLLWPTGATVQGATFSCHVTGVHDGDGPIYCAEGEKIRLTAIAARELDGSCRPGHPCPSASADAATEQLKRLAMGQTLRCKKTGTSYKRVTAWCWRPDGRELNCEMVRSGTAAYWRKFDTAGRLCGGDQREDKSYVRPG